MHVMAQSCIASQEECNFPLRCFKYQMINNMRLIFQYVFPRKSFTDMLNREKKMPKHKIAKWKKKWRYWKSSSNIKTPCIRDQR